MVIGFRQATCIILHTRSHVDVTAVNLFVPIQGKVWDSLDRLMVESVIYSPPIVTGGVLLVGMFMGYLTRKDHFKTLDARARLRKVGSWYMSNAEHDGTVTFIFGLSCPTSGVIVVVNEFHDYLFMDFSHFVNLPLVLAISLKIL